MKPVELVPTSGPSSAKRSAMGKYVKRKGAGISLTVNMRRQTPQEERQFNAAFSLIVDEIVRHELGRLKEKQS